MRIRINGEGMRVENGATVAALLALLDINAVGIAIELNREIVPKSQYLKTALKDNDILEVVRMAGGG
ncbi:MAG: sulfur carrier protein ThiS [Deltaproteobacteria bacterium]